MEGQILDQMIFTIVAVYAIAALAGIWLLMKILKWLLMKLFFIWRSHQTGVLISIPDGPVEELRWGAFKISGKELKKDIRCIGREPTPWNDRKGHLLSEEMITGVWDQPLDVLVLGMGIDGAVQCPPELCERLKSRGIPEILVLPTKDACLCFNELVRSGRRAALLAHGTC